MATLEIPRSRAGSASRGPTTSRLPMSLPTLIGLAATAGAGVIHLAAAIEASGHEAVLSGVLMLTGAVQLLLAVHLLDARARSRTATAWFQAACLVGLLAAVTVGLPILHPQPDVLDLAKALTIWLEVVAVAGLLYRGRRAQRGNDDRRSGAAGRAALVVALVVLAPAVASADLAAGDTDGHGHTHADPAAHEH